MDNKLQEWTAPRLMRPNQADGTNKHLDLTEGVTGSALNITITNYAGICSQVVTGAGGAVAAGAVCGPS